MRIGKKVVSSLSHFAIGQLQCKKAHHLTCSVFTMLGFSLTISNIGLHFLLDALLALSQSSTRMYKYEQAVISVNFAFLTKGTIAGVDGYA